MPSVTGAQGLKINRREMFAQVLALPLAGAAVMATQPKRFRHGYLDVVGHAAHRRATGETLHVYLDGVDVTGRCFEADDQKGYVGLHCGDARDHARWREAGRAHVRDVHPRIRHGVSACRMRVGGRVEIRAGEPFA